ncbi:MULTISPECIES: 2-oxoacid:acceptor oxidoreductase subunit alpha [Desulfurella]|jgi:2-oxoglutarate ferredoxin oxidoreductase subunit alpha|uniref:2-oxoglutarate ferredoxin oxidoreductase subunit alpha n=1 Tax=Desulfurella multipotens TaxID=79269 RepID=A0A1G6K3I2_9BACT|nr:MULTISPECIES: 2-oxoacid:acceptor oxidoreductase subunit alpha [Desulfurella]AHF97112.1 2-oxoglutarate ferredoxin oxidoreductase subunit alpha [Desulfurella acetivorans A63]HEX14169.1 2-oxoacid:acceptor oxidoreductase subunit alpha [Desulfurella acetivorans]PMP65505.1 MAG: 2-oxoglutarate synthase subunit alpha [Desulfurella multipotens]PMP88339.1 MAG: 2-oxoglutarate synthase subunit alpha [Desulfurella sp.]SDC25612.1 2-oxoglutarate ferredoxin oxidoreductase subunit alpha [Desulfurella multip
MSNVEIANGNELVAEAAIAAGCRFYAGYPITPSSEIPEHLSKRMPEVGGVFMQFEDEIASVIAAIGASYAGYKSMTATSGPGLSLKQEGIGLACMMELPLVVVDVMRGGPSTGLPTRVSQADYMQARWGTHGDHMIIAIAPSTLIETYTETIRAFNLAEKYRTPVLLLTDAVLAHLHGRVEIPDISNFEIIERTQPTVPPEEYYPYDVERFGIIPPLPNKENWRKYKFHMTGLNKDKTGFPTVDSKKVEEDEERMINKIMNNIKDIESFEYYRVDDADVLVIAYGTNATAARVAIDEARSKGIKVGMFRPITVWPFPEAQVFDLSKKFKKIIVSEINLGQMLYEVQRASKGNSEIFTVLQAAGVPIRPQQILEKIEEVSK